MVNYLKVVKLSSYGKYLDKFSNLLEEHILIKEILCGPQEN
jgi:hypothetical protein